MPLRSRSWTLDANAALEEQRSAWALDAKQHLEEAAVLAQSVMESLRDDEKFVLADEWECLASDIHAALSKLLRLV